MNGGVPRRGLPPRGSLPLALLATLMATLRAMRLAALWAARLAALLASLLAILASSLPVRCRIRFLARSVAPLAVMAALSACSLIPQQTPAPIVEHSFVPSPSEAESADNTVRRAVSLYLLHAIAIARLIGHATLITCATPAYLKAFGVPAYPDELRNGHRLVSYLSPQTGKPFPLRFERQGEKIEITSAHRIGVNESNAHLAAGLAGLGIIQTFNYSLSLILRQGEMVEILHDWRPAGYPFHLVYPQNRHVTQRLRVFIDWLVECFPARVAGEGKSGT